MKMATVECTFPELLIKHMYKTGRGTGSSARIAIARAFADALKQVRKKHVHTIKATITIIEKSDPKEIAQDEARSEGHLTKP